MNKYDLAIKNKLGSYYPVKSMQTKSIEDINMNKRTVTGVLNTSYYIDQDNDMILPGAVAKSLNENGPKSQAPDNIKYQIDHSLKANDSIGRFDVLVERQQNGVHDLYFEGFLPPGISDGHLIKYQTGVYTQHSIGFQYVDITIAEKDSDVDDYAFNWEKYYPLAINPEAAEERNFFFVVKEYKLFEGSVVTFGSNKLTGYLGSKSANKETYLLDFQSRLDNIHKLNKNKKQFDLEILQLKQIINEMYTNEPSVKDTLMQTPFIIKDTQNKSFIENWHKSINK